MGFSVLGPGSLHHLMWMLLGCNIPYEVSASRVQVTCGFMLIRCLHACCTCLDTLITISSADHKSASIWVDV